LRFVVICLFALVAHAAYAGETLDAVRKAGTLTCGAVIDQDDYSEADTHGNLSAFGADFCRALTAEIFGAGVKPLFLSVPDEPSGLKALRDSKISVLFGATPDPVIGGVYGVGFGPPMFLDGQGFLVSTASGIETLADLAGKRVCFINASKPEQVLYDVLEPMLREREIRMPYSERGEMEVALVDGHCDAITGDISWMANVRAAFHAQISRFKVLPETLTVDPFAPAYRVGDAQWASLVDWTVWVLMQAEAHKVTQANAGAPAEDADITVRRLLGTTPWIARALGIGDDGFRNALVAVGNYGEIFERNIGAHSRLDLPRGRNRLVSAGGAMWALPVEPLQ